MEELERCHTIAIQDVTLKVIAQHVEDGEWELCVENSHGESDPISLDTELA